MDYFPLFNSLRIASVSTLITFFSGITAAYFIAKLGSVTKGVLDCLLTMPMVLPPTVIGFFTLVVIGPRGVVGAWLLNNFDLRLTMTWKASVIATTIVTFPLMYRTARGAFEHIDRNLIYAAQTLGRGNLYIFRRVVLPNCKQGILAGVVLSFARGIGEYGATSMVSGYMPGRTATVSTTVYHLWQTGFEGLAYRWVGINLAISFTVMVAVNLLERRNKTAIGV
ncbi:MAG: molybdate ABC transporter permease subunit [Oscillospiraceae bacterium]